MSSPRLRQAWHAVAVLVVSLCAMPAVAQASIPCPGGAVGVAAQVVHVSPPGATATRRAAGGGEQPLGLNGLVCNGDVLVFSGGTATQLELRAGDRKIVLTEPATYKAPSGAIESAARAAQYIGSALAAAGSILAPQAVPSPTAARGTTALGEAFQIRALHALDRLPHQNLTPDLPRLLSWREGKPPYVCQSISEIGEVVQKGGATAAASCEIPAGPTQATQLAVRDGEGKLTTWNISPVAWQDLPRPDWLRAVNSPQTLSQVDRTAWAWWLWKQGGPAWRLQALAMLNQEAGTVWVAAQLRDGVLADVEAYAP